MEAEYKQTEISKEIVSLSTKLFQQSGYKSFSYRDIAKEIGIKTSSIHYYFPSKDDLALIIVKQYRKELAEELNNISSKNSDPHSRLDLYMDLYINSFRQNKTVSFLSMLTMDLDNLPEIIRKEVFIIINDSISWIQKTIEDGYSKKVFHFDQSPGSLAQTVFSALHGATITSRSINDESALLSTIESIKKMLATKDKGIISKYLSIGR
ncbi:MAG TPA: TetR/AcrR family transcriptional regulator [Thermodesulfobacteriota bacterium]|jgi:TetR/AcrR family transcriptional repressor of nem operon|nr:TetR/AcrR family transcriptional regulator [Thermodesulfobacteriota bacterium]